MGGSFQTNREIFENPIWKNIVEFRLFFLIYGNAVFSEEGCRVADDLLLQRGQWLRSTRKLQDDLTYIENRQVKTYSTSVIHRAILSLVKAQRLCTRKHELGTVFTVHNYEQYQGFSGNRGKQLGTELGTVEEQSENNNKNVKNDKNELIKDIYDFWNDNRIIVHREMTKKMSSSINARLKVNTPKDLKESISNYNTIITSELYWYTHKFTLDKFMDPKNLEQFMTINNPFENFRKQKGSGRHETGKGNVQSRGSASSGGSSQGYDADYESLILGSPQNRVRQMQ